MSCPALHGWGPALGSSLLSRGRVPPGLCSSGQQNCAALGVRSHVVHVGPSMAVPSCSLCSRPAWTHSCDNPTVSPASNPVPRAWIAPISRTHVWNSCHRERKKNLPGSHIPVAATSTPQGTPGRPIPTSSSLQSFTLDDFSVTAPSATLPASGETHKLV